MLVHFENILVPKDPELADALMRAARAAKPGTSESALLRELAISAAENLVEQPDPTPQQIQRVIDQWTSKNPPWDRDVLDRLDTAPQSDEPRSRLDTT